ncbi:hypothetical protein HYALB_00005299 [Hymenoscyphus albidus]|uniref:NB-ARC domain-containing protein n=1 Tax=Hymenoscyphus albidus TaxID=595503 RepID=A0A9N9LGA9_9HELO|nr:hypothetical protein HYALB_00005299 [Hymenoscyphus albidus]
MLFDKDRRAKGTSAVLIQCLPGGGKTHLAREYVYNHQKDYPGGIFWTRAKSFEELAAAYWDIAKKTVFKDNVDKKAFSPDDSEQFIKLVKKWLNNRQEWLLVFDGIHFDDTERLMKFLPDQRNTSIIYTSTEKAVSGDYHFNDPQVIRLPTLSAREARELLLLELGKKEPSQKDLEYSMDLVRAMEFLPIVIHTAAQRLKMTDEPLSRYAKSYASEPRLRGLGTYKVVVEQLEHMGARESLNLMQILVFFSQHIPVEMVSLGLRILDIPVKAFEPVTGRSLNNTFRFLNIFALVDRNETRAHSVHSVHSSQSSKGSRDMLAENLDVIRLHGVVQGFFIDTMNGDESLPHWLSRAVGVFCCSYDSASSRIASKSHTGLVEDYRLYEIHGNRLKQHVVRFKKRYPVLDEAHQYLDQSLEKIKTEIEQKTPESSQNIAGGQSDAFQTSIFDRTSSSSDTGPETPGRDDDERNLRLGPQAHWLDQGHLESPSSLTHDMEYQRHHQIYDARPYEMPDGPTNSHNNQHSLHQSEEGYESDMEGSVAMTLQPSQRTIQQQSESPTSPASAEWTKVERRAKKPERLDLHQHRTIKRMENQRYRDRAGSFRAVSALDPRTSHETAHGHFQSSSSRAESRGRLSGHSSAEVALTHIAQASPAPARGRGKIRDRPSSQRPEHRRVRSGIASYASAVTSPTNDTISGLPIPRPKTRDTSTESVCGSAVTSLQRFPLGVSETSSSRSQYTPMPPYPLSPGVERHDPLANPDSNLYNLRDNFDIPMRDAYPRQNENMFHTSDNRQDTHIPNYPTKVYPRMTAPLPLETRARSSSGPLKRDLPHEYSYWHSQGYPANEEQVPSSMSLSSPNIKSTDSPYYPGRPEFSFSSTPARFDGGYTSQPMSRDQSGQSAQSNRSRNGVNIGVGHRRRPSVAETEPIPSLPTFSPTIPPTSYRVYQQNTDPELIHMRKERERTPGYPVTKSPRLGYASHASRESQESLDRWNGSSENLPPPRRTFNPRTPAFTPSIAQPTPRPPSIFSTRAHSTTAVPPPKRNSLTLDQGPYSAPQSKIHSPNPNYTSSRTSPHPLQTSQFPPPPSPPRQYQPTASPPRHLRSFTTLEEPDGLGVGMVRGGGGSGSGSGGMMVGDGKVIGFGDFPEKVDIVGARERVERTWVERGESGLREGSSSVKGVGLGLDFRAGERR